MAAGDSTRELARRTAAASDALRVMPSRPVVWRQLESIRGPLPGLLSKSVQTGQWKSNPVGRARCADRSSRLDRIERTGKYPRTGADLSTCETGRAQ
jgi:hypothetical protein